MIQLPDRKGFIAAAEKDRELIFIELGLVGDAQLVPENGRALIAKGIGFGCLATFSAAEP